MTDDPRFEAVAQLLADNRPDQAVAFLLEAWSAEPGNLDIAVAYASLLARVGREDEALELFSSLADESGGDSRVWNNWGYILLTRGDPEGAILKLERALAADPDDFEAMVNMGIALDRLGRTGESLDHYRRAAAAAPDSPVVHNNMGAALWRAGRPEEALESFRQALRLNPRDASAANNMGVIRMAEGRYKDAEGYFRQALAIDPGSQAASGNLLAAARHRKQAHKEAGRSGDEKPCEKPSSPSLF